MQDLETMIAERNAMHGTVVTCLIADARVRNQNPEAVKKHNRDYRKRHKDDPIYKAKKAKWNMDYRQRKKEKQEA